MAISKILRQDELEDYLKSRAPLFLGAKVQQVELWGDQVLALELYQAHKFYLVLVLRSDKPFFFFLKDKPSLIKKWPKKKPVQLFLHTHAVGAFAQGLTAVSELGRVVDFSFAKKINSFEEPAQLTLRINLIPKYGNLRVELRPFIKTELKRPIKTPKKSKDKKEIWWSKPKEVPPLQNPPDLKTRGPRLNGQEKADGSSHSALELQDSIRAQRSIRPEEWEQQALEETLLELGVIKKQQAQYLDPHMTQPLQKWERALRAIERGSHQEKISQLEQEISQLQSNWIEINLQSSSQKSFQDQGFQREFFKALNQKYAELKKVKLKEQELLKRKQELRLKIQNFKNEQQKLGGAYSASTATLDLSLGLREKFKSLKLRKLQLVSSVAYLGKSARDNLGLIRAARAWDLWVHLKDMPGAHAVIFRAKNQVITESELRQVAGWIWSESQSGSLKKTNLNLIDFDFLVAEIRFVKPIKGDRVGRVRVQKFKIYKFTAHC
jgi:hypothetical protein